MALDAASNCYVWKPSLQANEVVKWSGTCVDGLADGAGRAEWFLDGVAAYVYTGAFKGGVLQGPGTMEAAGGDRYEGTYRDGKREGYGSYTAASGEQYKGEWRDNKREGRGILTYANGDRYDGDFKDNKRDGQGIYTKPDGERYEGEYKNDRREGRGVLVRVDGTRYEGLFKEGRPLGNLASPQATAKAQPVQPAFEQPAPLTAPPRRADSPLKAGSAPASSAPQPQPKHASQVAAALPEPALDPAKLEGDLNRALRRRDVRGVTAQVGDDGTVMLKGSAYAADKDRALQIARTFRGVKSVKDQVFVVE
jgi:hypothetical protein